MSHSHGPANDSRLYTLLAVICIFFVYCIVSDPFTEKWLTSRPQAWVVWRSRFSAVYQCNSCATDVDLSKTELVFRLGLTYQGLILLGLALSLSSASVSSVLMVLYRYSFFCLHPSLYLLMRTGMSQAVVGTNGQLSRSLQIPPLQSTAVGLLPLAHAGFSKLMSV